MSPDAPEQTDPVQDLEQVLDRLSGAMKDLPKAVTAVRRTLHRQQPASVPDPADPLVLVIDTRVHDYAEAMALVRQAYGMGGVRVHTVPGEVVWRDTQDSWIQQWDEELLHAFLEDLPPQTMLAAWRLSMTPGTGVGIAELGAFIAPDGSVKEQLTAANVAIRQGNAHCRKDINAYGGMPFTKTHQGRRNAGPVRYTADPAVAAVLLDAIRRSPAYPQLRRMQPLLPAADEDGADVGRAG
jgi:hypothetical protein